MEASDAQLAQQAIAGDAASFGRLVERHRAPLIAYVVGIAGRRDDAEEVAQDAFLRAWEKLDELSEPAAIGGWIYRIAHNLAISRVRQPRPVPLVDDPPQADGQVDPRMASLLAAVAKLSEPHRDVIARKHFAGCSGHEIAGQLGIAEGTVRSRLARAYEELRAMLREDE